MFVEEGIKWRRFFSFYFLHWRGKEGFEFLYVIRVFESDVLSVKSFCGCKDAVDLVKNFGQEIGRTRTTKP